MTVFENVAFGLRVKPRPLEAFQGRDKSQGLLIFSSLYSWTGWLDRSPGHSSLVDSVNALPWLERWPWNPMFSLLDEPFGALDAKVRLELRRWLRRLHDEIHVTSFLCYP